MASTIRKMQMATPGFMSRSNDDRRAYRAKMKAEVAAYARSPEGHAEQERINAAHAAWVASGCLKPDAT